MNRPIHTEDMLDAPQTPTVPQPGNGPGDRTSDRPGDRRRHAAGEDPQKREQILLGAWKIFVDQGFDAATMNSICRAAGVSKGTLYVYFENKEDLFVALVESKREAFFDGVVSQLNDPGTVEEKLLNYAVGLARLLNSEDVMHAQRIVISVVERMPELGTRFYDAGARHFIGGLRDFLQVQAEAGTLAVTDPDFAAKQFVELATSGTWRARLFGHRPDQPEEAELAHAAEEAVRMFMARYGGTQHTP